MKGYWHNRTTSPTLPYDTKYSLQNNPLAVTQPQNTRSPQKGTFQQQFQKQGVDTAVGFLQKKANKLTHVCSRIGRIQDFYQIMCTLPIQNKNNNNNNNGASLPEGQQMNKMALRCFQHNNQIILYCVSDHKLLCANCMFGQSQAQSGGLKSPKKQNRNQKKISKTPQKLTDDKSPIMTDRQTKPETQIKKPTTISNETRHSKHEVKQCQKSTPDITTDIKNWQFQLQQYCYNLSSCESTWQSMLTKFQKCKKSIFAQLDKQYDRLQMLISHRYLQTKQEITKISEQYQNNINKIAQSYKTIRRLLIPTRYPIPYVKHCWLHYMNDIIKEVPMNNGVKDNNQNWMRGYQGRVKYVAKRFFSKTQSQININNSNNSVNVGKNHSSNTN